VCELDKKKIQYHYTRGISKPIYEPKLFSKVKYSISHYMSNHHLWKLNLSFVNKLSSIYSPKYM